MLIALVAIFITAIAAPWFHRRAGSCAGWLLAIVPLVIGVFFLSHIEQIRAGTLVYASQPWVPDLDIAFSFYLDGLSLLFALLITGIGTIVVIYAGGYLAGDARLGALYAYLFFFMGSMLGLVLADNLLTLFMFWELTSISSYLLIGFNHERKQARAAALQALLVTGAGGLALLAGLLLLGMAAGTFEISAMLDQSKDIRQHALYVPILLLILAGAFTKSAQFPFHFWLPNAMEAPTPISAYLHSATMVKAGVYLIARMNPILGETTLWFYLIAIIGAVTTLFGAYLAFRATDLKQILAFSTISLLGTLTMLLGMGTEMAMTAAMVLLLAHALYKAAMFLVAGAIDHATHQRDVRHLGGLRLAMPITMTAGALAGLSMAGVLPTFGFLGKELYYEAVGHLGSVAWQFVAVAANILMVAVAGLVCVKPFVGPRTAATMRAHEAPVSLWLGPAVLGVLGLAIGIVPQATAQPLVSASVASVIGEPATVKLELWHGVNLTLLLSLLTLAGGAVLYVLRNRLSFLDTLDARVPRYGPARLYQHSVDALNFTARWQTRVLQNGYLRFYLLTIIGTTIALVWTALRDSLLPQVALEGLDVRFYEAVLAALILLGALFAVRARSRLASIAGLGVVGYAVAAVFVLFGAPDLAMTQFVVETLTVILLVLVFYHLPDFKMFSSKRSRRRDAVVALLTGGTITTLLLFATTVRSHHPVSDYFAQHSVPDGHGRNIVNVILVDFRALDTLGEITVLAIAGIGVYALLKLRLAGADREPRQPTETSAGLAFGRELGHTDDGRRRLAEAEEDKSKRSPPFEEEDS